MFGLDTVDPRIDAALDVSCTDDSACTRGELGRCDCGTCSYLALACPDSNRRYETPDGSSGACVAVPVQLDAAVYHVCARMSDGTAWCWGMNTHNQLGAGQPVNVAATAPVQVVGTSGPVTDLVEVRAGSFHTCGRRADGTVVCWGNNSEGQLGGGLALTVVSPDPVVVATSAGPLTGVTRLAVGFYHNCVGVGPQPEAVYCWGANARYQLGATTPERFELAVPWTARPTGALIALGAGGEHTCAILRDPGTSGTTFCWGRTNLGMLGNTVTSDGQTEQPQLVQTATGTFLGAFQIDTAVRHSCAMRNAEMWCWGQNNDGKLGDGTEMTRAIATRVVITGASGDYTEVAGGERHTCARIGTDTWCWGFDGDGRVGDGDADTSTKLTPVRVITGETLRDLAVGFDFTCTLSSDLRVRCWGANNFGQLGVGDLVPRHAPTEIPSSAFCPRSL